MLQEGRKARILQRKSAVLMVQGKSRHRTSEIGSAICAAGLGAQLNERVPLWAAGGIYEKEK